MTYFKDIQNVGELKETYRRLAFLYHPDKGGDHKIMQHINYEYELLKKKLPSSKKTLADLKEGDTVFVNGTPCTVLYILKSSFLAMANHGQRSAWFCSKTGLCKTSTKFRASLDNICYN